MSRVLPHRLAALVGAVAVVAVGCGGDDGSVGSLQGIVRSTPLAVGGVAVSEPATGEPFDFVAEPGELLVVYFGYTNCPDVCPTTLAALKAAEKELGDDADKVDLAMVTVDPARDTADVLAGYLSSFADRSHALVPADDAELRAAEAAFLASSEVRTLPDGTIEVDHSPNAYVVDDAGNVVVEWPFGHGTEGMTNDLEVLLDGLS